MMEGNTGMMGARFSSLPVAQAHFSAAGIMTPHEENTQRIHQQQMLQQQQIHRMALMRQPPPTNPGVMNQMDRMSQQKWPRQSMDGSSFISEQQSHQFFSSHAAHQGSTSGEDSQSMLQVVQSQMPQVQGMPLVPGQNVPPHQHYNPTMVNRFSAPINPQQPQQQMMFQQMQQHPTANRFPTSTSLEAAGIAGISPLALQQGILNADTKADNPPLVHPSLQGMSAKGRSCTAVVKKVVIRKSSDIKKTSILACIFFAEKKIFLWKKFEIMILVKWSYSTEDSNSASVLITTAKYFNFVAKLLHQ